MFLQRSTDLTDDCDQRTVPPEMSKHSHARDRTQLDLVTGRELAIPAAFPEQDLSTHCGRKWRGLYEPRADGKRS